ncbi:MAG TPA: hypothetical protein DCR71_01760, partial [Dehalococcoidia bacterium]|nr:hypothetical protein [Dehalococcoidia bacterium]
AMFEAAASMDYERAAVLRDEIRRLKGEKIEDKNEFKNGTRRTGRPKAAYRKPDLGVENVRSRGRRK